MTKEFSALPLVILWVNGCNVEPQFPLQGFSCWVPLSLGLVMRASIRGHCPSSQWHRPCSKKGPTPGLMLGHCHLEFLGVTFELVGCN